jgi:hypothetical protein
MFGKGLQWEMGRARMQGTLQAHIRRFLFSFRSYYKCREILTEGGQRPDYMYFPLSLQFAVETMNTFYRY